MRRFANIDSGYATALMASEDPRNLGWDMAKGTLGNIIRLDEAQNDADTTEYIGDRYASQTMGNALWGLGSSLLSPVAKQVGTNIGAGRSWLDSGEGGFFGPGKTDSTTDSYDYSSFGIPDSSFSFTDGINNNSYINNISAGSDFYNNSFTPSVSSAYDYNAFNNAVDYGVKYNPSGNNSLSLADLYLSDRAW